MILFTLCLVACGVTAALGFLLGSYLHYQRGVEDGFHDGYSLACADTGGDCEPVWQVTTSGRAGQAPAAQREPVVLSLHPSFLKVNNR